MAKTPKIEQKLFTPEEVLGLLQNAESSKNELEKKIYTVNEVAKILQTNIEYVHKLRKSGILRFIKVGQYKCRQVTLDEFLEKYDGCDITDPYNVKALASEPA